MARGELKGILDMEAYRASQKDWFIESLHSKIYWYELLVNKHQLFDTKKLIRDELSVLKKHVEDNLEKRFIYFIFSRTKVRFDSSRQPTITAFRKRLKVHLLIGKQQKRISVSIDAKRVDGKPIKASVDDKFITISISEEDQVCMSVHDFLLSTGVSLGLFSKIHYIGYTKNPQTRPTNGAHSGLSKILHNVSNDDNDILISFNLFKVTTKGSFEEKQMDFIIANSMTDEISVDLEGYIIEKCLILYFDSNNQDANKDNERSELLSSLRKLKSENRIRSIQLHYEIDDPLSDYFTFYSDNVSPNLRHVFTVKESNDAIMIAAGSTLYSEVYRD